MSKILKKVLLDEDIIDIISKEYKAEKGKIMHLENYSCFSEPDMSRHCCDYSKGPCNFCHSNPDLWGNCLHICQISKVCLASYAVRLGYAQEVVGDAKKRLVVALTLPYEELLLVIDKLTAEENLGQSETQEVDMVDEKVVCECEECECDDSDECLDTGCLCCEQVEEEWVSVKDAAGLLECTVPNMYAHIKHGNVTTKTPDGKKRGVLVLVSSLKPLLEKRARKLEKAAKA